MDRIPAVKVSGLTFRYYEKGKRNIVDDLSLSIEAGSTTVILGSSGCGKSTFAALIAGLYPENGGYLAGGEIELFGHPVGNMDHRERAEYLTIMFQNPDLQFCMNTLRKELLFCLENICTPPEEMDGIIDRVSDKLHMAELLDRKIGTLSGGEKQKASICCLLAIGSRCIVLDEALANIDERSAKDIISMLDDFRRGGGTVIAIDHQPLLWRKTADRFILMGDGCRVIEDNIVPSDFDSYRELLKNEGVWGEYTGRPLKANPPSEAAIEFRNVSVRADPKDKRSGYILRDASMTLERGKMTALVGESGAGKTTTFLTVLKQRPFEGTVEIGGRDIRKMKEKDIFGKIGIVFQNPSDQFVTQKVSEEIAAGIVRDESGSAERYLEEYGLKKQERYSPYMLSQGQQRRLAVLSVLMGDQDIILLDEPTYGQDLRSTEAIMSQLQEKVDRDGLTVMFITHDMRLAEKWADRIVRLENGGFTLCRE